jgi:hypothetical protein
MSPALALAPSPALEAVAALQATVQRQIDGLMGEQQRLADDLAGGQQQLELTEAQTSECELCAGKWNGNSTYSRY